MTGHGVAAMAQHLHGSVVVPVGQHGSLNLAPLVEGRRWRPGHEKPSKKHTSLQVMRPATEARRASARCAALHRVRNGANEVGGGGSLMVAAHVLDSKQVRPIVSQTCTVQ